MNLRFEEKNKYLIISIDGRLDSLNAQDTDKKIENKIKDFEGSIIFDFENLEYMTSAGLQVILTASKNRTALGETTYIYKPQRIVDYVLKVSGFYTFLNKLDKLP